MINLETTPLPFRNWSLRNLVFVIFGFLLILDMPSALSTENLSCLASTFVLPLLFNNSFIFGESPLNSEGRVHTETVQHLIDLLDRNPKTKDLVKKSIRKASEKNPDRITNPAQTLDEFFAFLDWSLSRMPWSFFPDDLFHGFAEKTDQSILYPYWLLDQPLDELKGRGFFYPSVQYLSPINEWLVAYNNAWGDFLNSEDSWCDAYLRMIEQEGIFRLHEYESPDNWRSYNDFFSRRILDGARPISGDNDPTVICAPADALPQGVWNISSDGYFYADAIETEEGVSLKSATFVSVDQLLGPEGAEFAHTFYGGYLTHTYLSYEDYHRFHSPVSGLVKRVYTIPHDDSVGGVVYWSANLQRYVLESNTLSWQTYETRGCVIIETAEYGLVAVLPIGMGQISSVNWEDGIAVGARLTKGDKLGYFLFGGSDCVLIFQKEAGFVLTCPKGGEGTYANGYAHILQGEELGRFNNLIEK